MAKIQLEGVLKLIDVQIDPSIFQKISRATASLPTSLNVSVKAAQGLNTQMKTVHQTITKTHDSMVGMSNIAKTFLQRMAQFAVLLPIFATLNKSIQGGVAFITEFEHELINVIKVNPEELTSRLREIVDTTFDIATAFGVSATEVIGTTKVFVQAGFDIAQAMELSRAATLAAKVTTLDLVQSQELLIAVTKQFSDEGLSAVQIIDKIGKAEDVSASNAIDFFEAFRTGGNALAFATKSLDNTLGLIAATREQTRKSGAEIGTFFKTLSTRILAAGDSQNVIKRLGIAIEDTEGKLRPLQDILSDLKVRFDQLTEAEQATLSSQIAGVRQVEGFMAALKSLDRAHEITANSANAEGTANKRLALVMTELKSKVGVTIAEFQHLAEAFGEAGVLDTFKKLVEQGGSFAKFLTSMVSTAKELGIALAPLLTLAGLKAGGKIFGTSGFGAFGKISAPSREEISERLNRASRPQSTQDLIRQRAIDAELLARQKEAAANFAKLSISLIALSQVSSTLDAVFERITDHGKRQASAFEEAAHDVLGAGLSAAKAGLLFGPWGVALSLGVEAVNQFNKALNKFSEAKQAEKMNQSFTNLVSNLQHNTSHLGNDIADILEDQISKSGGKVTDKTLNSMADAVEGFLRQKSSAGSFKGQFEGFQKGSIFDPQVIKQIAQASERFVETQKLITQGASPGKIMHQLWIDLGADTRQFSEEAKRQIEDTEEFIKGRDIFSTLIKGESDLIEIRTKLREVQSQNIDVFQSEIEIRKKELEASENLINAAQAQIDQAKQKFLQAPETFGVTAKGDVTGEVTPAGEVARQFIEELENGIKNIGPDIQGIFTNTFKDQDLSDDVKSFIDKIIGLEKEAESKRLETATKARDLRKAIAKEELDVLLATKKANDTLNESLRDIQQTFIDLGFGVKTNKDDLTTLANLTSKDFHDILNNTGDFTESVRNAVKLMSGKELEKAVIGVNIAAEKSAFSIEFLTQKLEEVSKELNQTPEGTISKTGQTRAQLIQEQAKAQADLDKAIAQAAIEAAQANLKYKEALKDNVEEVKKIDDAFRKLKDAQKDFRNELNESEKAFNNFLNEKFQDLAQQEADVEQQLADAHKSVIDSTEALSDAFFDFQVSILEFNGHIAQAKINANLLAIEIDSLGGGLNNVQERLVALNKAYTSVLNETNLTLQDRINLEKQLAETTLSFLQQAQSSIVQAGLGVFGQTGQENRDLAIGIEGLRVVAEKLGGSFDHFLALGQDQFKQISQELLNLPISLREKILNALTQLPTTAKIGGFSPEELRNALGAVGAGVAPEAGLPALPDLIKQQAIQLNKLQDLGIKDAQLQITQVLNSQKSLEAAKAQLEEAKVQEAMARENAIMVRDQIAVEVGILQMAAEQREQLTERLIAATNESTVQQIQEEAKNFERQISSFQDVGSNIVQAIDRLASAKIAIFGAGNDLGSLMNQSKGYIPNYGMGNLSPQEVNGLIKAAQREKSQMPAGAQLAVANTDETIIPNRNRGFIPNYEAGNERAGLIASTINSIRGVNPTVVSAVSRSVIQGLQNIQTGGKGQEEVNKILQDRLDKMLGLLTDISNTNTNLSTKLTNPTTANTTAAAPTTPSVEEINFNIQTNQQSTVTVQGLNNLQKELEKAIQEAALQQLGNVTAPINEAVVNIFKVLRERGLISSIGVSQ